MSRKALIDAPGNVIGAILCSFPIGLQWRPKPFLSRLGDILTETKTACYAWVLIPNHFHLLLRMCDHYHSSQ